MTGCSPTAEAADLKSAQVWVRIPPSGFNYLTGKIMDNFIELLRIEFEKRLYNEKSEPDYSQILTIFDKACITAIIQYAKKHKIVLD